MKYGAQWDVGGDEPGRYTFATVLVGRSDLSREGLARILSAGGFQVAGSASRVSELDPISIRSDQPLLLIIDAGADLETAIKDIEVTKQERPAARIAVLAGGDDIRDLVSLFRAGAHACLARKATLDVFLKSLELVMLGETLLPQAALAFILGHEDERPAHRIWSPSDDPTAKFKVGDSVKCVDNDGVPVGPENNAPRLSAQETRILRNLAEGHSNKAIARAFEIAEATVKVHVKAILRKIKVTNRTQAALWAMHNPPPPESGKEDRSPELAPAAVQPTPPSDAGIDGDSPIQPPGAELPAAGHAVAETTAESLSAHNVKAKLGSAFLQQRRTPLAQRGIAEEKERLANLAAKTHHLRELRQLRESAEREALERGSGAARFAISS
jgi:two-component system nitrate/nitrite response regulator NarL